MRRRLLAAVLMASALAGITAGAPTAGSAPESPSVESKKPPRAVISRTRKYPDRYKRRTVKFVPYARPSPAQVKRIIRWEAARWGVSPWSLNKRIACESGLRWDASNGQYKGLGQFHPGTFWRGWKTMPKGVSVKLTRLVRRHTVKIARFNDGTVKRAKGFKVKVRRTRILKGVIDVRGNNWHGYAQVRIVAQALAGKSAVRSSEWSCPA